MPHKSAVPKKKINNSFGFTGSAILFLYTKNTEFAEKNQQNQEKYTHGRINC